MLTMRGAALAAVAVSLPYLAAALPASSVRSEDPCAKIAGKTYVPPADALACLKVFPFNETLRQNVISVVSTVFDFYTFEDYYLDSPPPFQESTKNIRAELSRINSTKYETDYDFNKDLYDMTNTLNDGHTAWFPSCYWQVYQNVLPAPIVSFEEDGVQSVYIAPDSVEFISQLGDEFTSYFESIDFNWQRLAGAKVLSIEGEDPFSYADKIADTETGNYLDHGVRVNSVFSSYRLSDTAYSQRLGDIAGPVFPDKDSLTLELVLANSSKKETVTVPYLASFIATETFADKESYWANLCAANNETNGVDVKTEMSSSRFRTDSSGRRLARSEIVQSKAASGIGLPTPFVPTLPTVNGSEGVIKNYILPDGKTGVMFIGSFSPDDYNGFQVDVDVAVKHFKSAGVTHLLIDLSNNGGGYVCLGVFLHNYLAGASFGNGGFQSAVRANTLAQKILDGIIHFGLNSSFSFYAADGFAFTNNTQMPESYDYFDPDVTRVINKAQYAESQRLFDVCTPYVVDLPKEAPFDFNNVAIVGNANCASTCAQFSTVLHERHNVTTVSFGGKPGEPMEFKGMAGDQVLEWTDIDTEIKSAGLANDPLAPPDLLVNADMRHNWRTAYSWLDESTPIAYKSERSNLRFPYTRDTYMNPQNLWVFAASQVFNATA